MEVSDLSRKLFDVLGKNGWMWQRFDKWAERDCQCFKCSFLSVYRYDVLAVVATSKEDLCLEGSFGVLWLEIIGTPDYTIDEYSGMTYADLKHMMGAIEIAEENLVRCGVPFALDYDFHGKNKANLKRRNDATRRRLKLEELEKEYAQ